MQLLADASAGQRQYTSYTDVIQSIYREEGVRGSVFLSLFFGAFGFFFGQLFLILRAMSGVPLFCFYVLRMLCCALHMLCYVCVGVLCYVCCVCCVMSVVFVVCVVLVIPKIG